MPDGNDGYHIALTNGDHDVNGHDFRREASRLKSCYSSVF